jgi:hypothetical protein
MRRTWALILVASLLGPAAVNAGDFDRVVHEFSRQSGATQTHIPFFFLAKAAVAVAHPAGTSQINLAVFENAAFDPDRFSRLTDAAVHGDWKPMIRVRSRSGESTNIYAKPAGRDMHLLIATYENSEATFVEVRVEPQALMQFIEDHDGHNSKN